MGSESFWSLLIPSALVVGGVISIFWPGAVHRTQTRLEEHPGSLNVFRSGRHDPEGRSVPYIGIGMLVVGVILFIVRGIGLINT